MQRLSRQYAGLADGYFLAGLEHLEQVLESMDHRTLQCLLVMAQYALVTPTRMAVSGPQLLAVIISDLIPEKSPGIPYSRYRCSPLYATWLSPGTNNHVERDTHRRDNQGHAKEVFLESSIYGVCYPPASRIFRPSDVNRTLQINHLIRYADIWLGMDFHTFWGDHHLLLQQIHLSMLNFIRPSMMRL